MNCQSDMNDRTQTADTLEVLENKRCFCMCDCNVCKYCEVGGEFVKKFKISKIEDSATETKSMVILNTGNKEDEADQHIIKKLSNNV